MSKKPWTVVGLILMLALPTVAACVTPSKATGDVAGELTRVEADPKAPGGTSGAPATQNTGGAQDPGTLEGPGEGDTQDPGTSGPGEGGMLDPKPSGTTTLRGTASAGVEVNCMLLAAEDGKAYLLLGGDRERITSGARLEVSVLIQADMMTTCMQGIPATVLTVRTI